MVNLLDYSFHYLNTSNYFIGLMMIFLNIGSRYFSQEFGSVLESVLNNQLVRSLLIFTIFFTTTRDIKTSIILTASFIIIVLELFNEKSKLCIIPKNILDYLVTDHPGKVSNDEIQKSLQILKKAGYLKNNLNKPK